jgi:hypothetical protein
MHRPRRIEFLVAARPTLGLGTVAFGWDDMSDFYPAAKQLSDYVFWVIAHLSVTMGDEAAALRVLEHLQVVLQAGMEGTPPEDMASILKPDQPA